MHLCGTNGRFFERPFIEQRIEHQSETGDRCTSLWLSETAMLDLAGDASVPDEPITTTPDIDLLHRQLVVALRCGIDRFELIERLARLVGAVTERAAPGRFTARRSATRDNHHRVVQQAREAIVADPSGADFRDLGCALGYTRFHISRVFSRATGMTLSQFRNRVRVAVALDRLAEGHQNLAVLASELGFVDQSHFSRVVRAYTGDGVSMIRRQLEVGS